MFPVKIIKGFKPLHFVGDKILFSKGFSLYFSDHSCEKFEYIGTVPHSFRRWLESRFRWVSRIFRTGLASGCVLPGGRILLAEKRRIWLVDVEKGQIDLDHEVVRGSRPLSITFLEELSGFDRFTCCYGEYWENTQKDEVRIWGRGVDGVWSVAYTFPKGTIEHVHAVIPDKSRNFVWILTGDFGNAAGLWKATGNFSSVEPVLVGEQHYRCVSLFFSRGDIYYATDSQLEKNSFRKLLFDSGKARSEFILKIPGSSIYSCEAGGRFIFSTTVEPGMLSGYLLYDLFDSKPGPGIEGKEAGLFVWDPDYGMTELAMFEKDFFPPRLFQFGSLCFPLGYNTKPDRLYAYATALSQYDDCTMVFDLGCQGG